MYQSVSFDTNAILNGWSHPPSSISFICNQAGIYDITYTGVFKIETDTLATFSMAARLNGTKISGSDIPTTTQAANSVIKISQEILASVALNDNLTIVIGMSGTGGTGIAGGNPRLIAGEALGNSGPSASLVITRVA